MKHSPLAKLPSEVRNGIYSLTLPYPDTVHVDAARPDSYGLCIKGTYRKAVRKRLRLRMACEQDYSETAGLFFSLNSFHLGLGVCQPVRGNVSGLQAVCLAPFDKYAEAIGDNNASSLTSLTLGAHMVRPHDLLQLELPALLLELFQGVTARSATHTEAQITLHLLLTFRAADYRVSICVKWSEASKLACRLWREVLRTTG